MAVPHVLVLRAPGTNCDLETAHAFERGGARAQRVHVNRVLERPQLLQDFQILCLPGGFSYGDDISAGRILGSQLRRRLSAALAEFKQSGKLILGICNGFQILTKTELLWDDLPAHPQGVPPATLTFNQSGKYEDRWVRLRIASEQCVFLRGMESLYLPVAHAEGRFVARDGQTLDALDSAGRFPLRYARLDGQAAGEVPYPENPNGAAANIAGMCDASGRVLGLMPHPERHLEPQHHPRWTRGEAGPAGDGLQLFRNAVAYFA